MIDKVKFKSFDELPIFLDVKIIGSILGISRAGSYDLMHEEGFPSLRIGNKLVAPKDKFIDWVNKKLWK